MIRLLLATFAALTITACMEAAPGVPPPGDPIYDTDGGVAGATDELLGGEVSWNMRAVGSFETPDGGSCTATLVARRVAITAAHCVDYGSRTRAGDNGVFWVHLNARYSMPYRVIRYRSYGTEVGPDDIALLQLAEPVPEEIVRLIRPLASSFPADGERVTLWGMGCTSRRTGEGGSVKRVFRFVWPRPQLARLCPGDSGGPMMRRNGRIFQINSGYWITGGRDVYASVPWNYGRLMQQVRAWQ